jgi:hypothetical protein
MEHLASAKALLYTALQLYKLFSAAKTPTKAFLFGFMPKVYVITAKFSVRASQKILLRLSCFINQPFTMAD